MSEKTNPFENLTATNSTKSDSRKISFTPALIDVSSRRASDIMKSVRTAEQIALANKVLADGNATDTIDLIKSIVDDDQIKADASFLECATDDELSRLLESRRSDRSKLKDKNLSSNVLIARQFIAAMYAELVVRTRMNKPYQAGSSQVEIDYDNLTDSDAINRKIKSLQSKKCRLAKTAPYVQDDQEELERVNQDISRLQALRPSGSVSSKTIIKSADVTAIREALAKVNQDELPTEIKELLAKLG